VGGRGNESTYDKDSPLRIWVVVSVRTIVDDPEVEVIVVIQTLIMSLKEHFESRRDSHGGLRRYIDNIGSTLIMTRGIPVHTCGINAR
jgi:hypothetical protein